VRPAPVVREMTTPVTMTAVHTARPELDEVGKHGALLRVQCLMNGLQTRLEGLLEFVNGRLLLFECSVDGLVVELLATHRLRVLAARAVHLITSLPHHALRLVCRLEHHLLLTRRGVESLEEPVHHPPAPTAPAHSATVPSATTVPTPAGDLDQTNEAQRSNDEAEHVVPSFSSLEAVSGSLRRQTVGTECEASGVSEVKKREDHVSIWVLCPRTLSPQCFQVVVMMRLALLIAVISTTAGAQGFSAPPMVQADTVDPSQGRVITAPVIANAPLDPNTQVPLPHEQQQPRTQQHAEAAANPRFARICMSALLGAGLGTATAIIGGFLGGEYLSPWVTSIGNIWTGGAIGFAVGAPIGVLVSGLLFRGDAPWYAAVLGDLLGAAVGVATVAFGGPDALPITFALPLLGSIIGYEVGSSDDVTMAPTATVLPSGSGAMVGAQGRF
jgi:hypothetical protein